MHVGVSPFEGLLDLADLAHTSFRPSQREFLTKDAGPTHLRPVEVMPEKEDLTLASP